MSILRRRQNVATAKKKQLNIAQDFIFESNNTAVLTTGTTQVECKSIMLRPSMRMKRKSFSKIVVANLTSVHQEHIKQGLNNAELIVRKMDSYEGIKLQGKIENEKGLFVFNPTTVEVYLVHGASHKFTL